MIKYNPNDISIIYAYDKSDDAYLPVPALDQEYTKGLTLWQHIVIRNYARKIAESHVDRDALCRAKKRLQIVVERELLANKKISGSEKIARFLNLGQPTYVELMEEQKDEELKNEPNARAGEAIERKTRVNTESSLNGVSDVGDAFGPSKEVIGVSDVEIRQIHEGFLQATAGDAFVTDGASSKKPQLRGKAKEGTRASKRGESASAESRGQVSSNTELFSHNADEFNEEDWGADYDLPL